MPLPTNRSEATSSDQEHEQDHNTLHAQYNTFEGSRPVYVQALQPVAAGPYLWVQTGAGEDGTGWTIWIEDGG